MWFSVTTPANIRKYLIFLETAIIGLHFAADNMGLDHKIFWKPVIIFVRVVWFSVRIPREYLIFLETAIIGLHFAADNIGLDRQIFWKSVVIFVSVVSCVFLSGSSSRDRVSANVSQWWGRRTLGVRPHRIHTSQIWFVSPSSVPYLDVLMKLSLLPSVVVFLWLTCYNIGPTQPPPLACVLVIMSWLWVKCLMHI